jgi:hypothetical protein
MSYWRVAVDEINYRRFFDVNDLAALRMDETGVFDSTHRLIFELIDRGLIDGLRIDHVDGLYDPEAYLERLQWKPLYVVVEKILAPHERLPETWPVQGTTGYEFAALTTSWLVCNDYEVRMTRRYRQFTESDASFEQIAYDSKRLVMRSSLAAEIEVLATQLDRIAQLDRRTADFTRAGIREADSRSDRVLSGLPHLCFASRRQRRGSTPRELGRERRAQAQCRRRAQRVRLPARRAARRAQRRQVRVDATRDAGIRDEVPAGHFAGCGQGRRRYRALSLQPTGVSERGRQRSGPVRHAVVSVASVQRGARAGPGRTRCSRPRRTTRSAAKTSVRASPCSASYRICGSCISRAGRD